MDISPPPAPRWVEGFALAFFQLCFFGPLIYGLSKLFQAPNPLQLLLIQFISILLPLRLVQLKSVTATTPSKNLWKLALFTTLFYIPLSPLRYFILIGIGLMDPHAPFWPEKMTSFYIVGLILGVVLHFLLTRLGLRFLMKKPSPITPSAPQ